MRTATVNNQPTPATPGAPPVATCPACGGKVHKRKRRSGDRVTWFWRHAPGVGEGCPRRYDPGR